MPSTPDSALAWKYAYCAMKIADQVSRELRLVDTFKASIDAYGATIYSELGMTAHFGSVEMAAEELGAGDLRDRILTGYEALIFG